ncbi:11121_t:CDS:1, partial [Cetraspora pellucida]
LLKDYQKPLEDYQDLFEDNYNYQDNDNDQYSFKNNNQDSFKENNNDQCSNNDKLDPLYFLSDDDYFADEEFSNSEYSKFVNEYSFKINNTNIPNLEIIKISDFEQDITNYKKGK